LHAYIGLGSQPAVADVHIAAWWHSQHSLSTLKQLALDLWAIPAMADECERTFSRAKLTMTSQRQKMKIEVLEQLGCLRQWYKLGGAS
jgi:hypothetical protein